jgi:hypothetical protein
MKPMKRFPLCLATLAATFVFQVQSSSAQRIDLIVSTIIHDDSSKTLSVRDVQKRAMQQQTFSSQGTLAMKRLFQLDRHGKVRNGLAFDAKDNIIFRFRYEYDDLDRLSKERVMDRKGDIVRVLFTTYDEAGRATKKAVTYPKHGGDEAGQPHQFALDHPEMLELRGEKLSGNQLKQSSRTNGKPLKKSAPR